MWNKTFWKELSCNQFLASSKESHLIADWITSSLGIFIVMPMSCTVLFSLVLIQLALFFFTPLMNMFFRKILNHILQEYVFLKYFLKDLRKFSWWSYFSKHLLVQILNFEHILQLFLVFYCWIWTFTCLLGFSNKIGIVLHLF